MSIEYWHDEALESTIGPFLVRFIQILSLIFFLGLGMELFGIGMTVVEASSSASSTETTFVLLSGYPEYRQEVSFSIYEWVSPFLVRASDLFLWIGYYIRSTSSVVVITLLPYVLTRVLKRGEIA